MKTDDLDWLESKLAELRGHAGTIHRIRGNVLCLSAAQNIPEGVRAIVEEVPRGKGMAGQTWARDEPVFVCDLQSTESVDVRPGARKVDANAAIALPVHDGASRVCAVVGFAFDGNREFGASELQKLAALAESLPKDAAAQTPDGSSA